MSALFARNGYLHLRNTTHKNNKDVAEYDDNDDNNNHNGDQLFLFLRPLITVAGWNLNLTRTYI